MVEERDRSIDRLLGKIRKGVLGFLCVLLVVEALFSLQWPMQHDSPLLHYVAWLIDEQGRVPYRDVFETSMPGVFLIHLAIVKTVGYSDLAFKILDLVFLGLLSAVTWALMRPFGRASAIAATSVFGLIYLGYDALMTLQRDYIGILPIALATLIVRNGAASRARGRRALAVGALFGLSASIKPHLAIAAPLVILALCDGRNEAGLFSKTRYGRQVLKLGALSLIPFFGVFCGPLVWLGMNGGFGAFQESFTSYIPLHINLTGNHRTISGLNRAWYLLRSYRGLGGLAGLAPAAAFGFYLVLSADRDSRRKRLAALLAGMLAAYSIYPVLSGQFWHYHWMPFAYFAALSGALVLTNTALVTPHWTSRVMPLILFLFSLVMVATPAENFVWQLSGRGTLPVKEGRPDEIAEYLSANLNPGDTVQPLDWAAGAIHGMLLAKAVVATRYIYEYHFYHHISDPYIQHIRSDFIDQFEAAKPRFVIDVTVKARPWGPDTTQEFPELQRILDRQYRAVHSGTGFHILERTEPTPVAVGSGR